MSNDLGHYVVRSINADEWPAAKALRLVALRDPIAHLAFLETYEQAAARPDSFWQERAAGAAKGATGLSRSSPRRRTEPGSGR